MGLSEIQVPVASPVEIGELPFLAACQKAEAAKPARNKLARRQQADHSQRLRLGVQLFFLALNIWIGAQFYLWVRWAESGGRSLEVARPAGVEGWLPIESLMQLRYFVATGKVPRIHPAGFFLFLSFLAISFLFRKAFCSWLCPVGTVSEYLWKLGRYTFRRNFRLPRWADLTLCLMKYLPLGFFVFVIVGMSAAGIAEFLGSPYALIVDVRMLNFFRYLDGTAGVIVLLLIAFSIFVENFWCRYLCPYGAFLGLASTLSPSRIRRNTAACIDCGKCAKACPSVLPVDKLVQIRSAECTACLECVAVCPAKDALAIEVCVPGRRPWAMSPLVMSVAVIFVFLGAISYAKLTNRWNTILPRQVYLRLVPQANEELHPAWGPKSQNSEQTK